MDVFVPKAKPFADLLQGEQAAFVTLAIEKMILKSFAEDAARARLAGTPQPRQTVAEGKRRFNIVADWFGTLRGDLGWSLQRVLAELPRALRQTLDGDPYVPDTRHGLWAPPKSNGGTQ